MKNENKFEEIAQEWETMLDRNMMPLFEIETNIEGEYEIWNITLDTTNGEIWANDLMAELEDKRCLDYHLEGLYDLATEDMISRGVL